MKRKMTILGVAAALCLLACEKQPEFKQVYELGCASPETVVDSRASSVEFEVISSSDVEARIIEGDSWAEIEGGPWRGDFKLRINYGENTGAERRAIVELSCGNRQLLLKLIQDGEQGTVFSFSRNNITVPYTAGACFEQFNTGIPATEISGTVIYLDGGDWIEEPLAKLKDDGRLIFTVAENTSPEPRTAIIQLQSVDKVGREIVSRLYVTQDVRGKGEPAPLDIRDLGNLTLIDGDFGADGVILKDYVIEGRVISDNSEGNAAANLNMSVIIQDLTLSSRTVYLQSSEGGECRGVKLIFESADAISLNRYDLASISLKDAVFSRHENPEYYCISGLKASDIVSSVPGSEADVPQRHKKMSEVTDSDIHTLLTLEDCCIPVSKGPFVPIDQTRSAIINKYPMPLMDKWGSTAYLLTNTNAKWARDGKGLPQGSGTVSGIIVSEKCDNYEWSPAKAALDSRLEDYVTEIGEIGRWQIRPQLREEISLDAEPFTRILEEWKSYAEVVAKPGLSFSASEKMAISPSQDWSSPGPLSAAASGQIPQSEGPAWFGAYWFSGSHSDPDLESYYWEMEVSTAGLSAANAPMSVQIAAFNGVGVDVGAPRYWDLKWSADGENWEVLRASSCSSGDCVQNTAIGEEWTYTVPDYPKNGSYRQYHMPGAKTMCFSIPADADIWGKECVRIRLTPAMDRSGYDGALPISYDSAPIQNVRRAVLSYAAIRCNR